jgi:hypothetical protein
MAGVLRRRTSATATQKEKGHMLETEAEIAVMMTQIKGCGLTRRWEREARKGPPVKMSEEHGPANTLTLDFGL